MLICGHNVRDFVAFFTTSSESKWLYDDHCGLRGMQYSELEKHLASDKACLLQATHN